MSSRSPQQHRCPARDHSRAGRRPCGRSGRAGPGPCRTTFQGILQADGYSGFAGLYASGQINEASCWAHARRGFLEAYEKTKSPLALEALQLIGALYRIEELALGRTPTERQRLRNNRSAFLLSDLRVWLEATHARISGRSELAKAIRYTLSRWDSLRHILRAGLVCIDNSATERFMRPIAIGRRNWTFAGSDAGGERGVTIYSLIETAKVNGLDTEDYLRKVLERIADQPGQQGRRSAQLEHHRTQGTFRSARGRLITTPRSWPDAYRSTAERRYQLARAGDDTSVDREA